MDTPDNASHEPLDPDSPEQVYVVYDKRTGRIVHRHKIHALYADTSRPERKKLDTKEVLSLVGGDAMTLRRVTGQNPSNLAVVDSDRDISAVEYMVDPKSHKLIKCPALRLLASKTDLAGDGRDRVEIRVEVHDEQGANLGDFSGSVKVTTTHGKLSVERGLVRLTAGKGSITLTSTNETIDRVMVTATCPDRPCSPASLDLVFA